MILVLFTFYFHTHIGIDWLEDIYNGDMNKTTKYFFGKDVFIFNIATYMGHIVNIPILFLYQVYFFTLTGNEFTNKSSILRFNSLFDELPENWYSKSWIKWHVVDLNSLNNNDEISQYYKKVWNLSSFSFCFVALIF
jgi:hypothetical protein